MHTHMNEQVNTSKVNTIHKRTKKKYHAGSHLGAVRDRGFRVCAACFDLEWQCLHLRNRLPAHPPVDLCVKKNEV